MPQGCLWAWTFGACCLAGHISVKPNFSALFDSVLNYTLRHRSTPQAWFIHSFISTCEMLMLQVSHIVHFPLYLMHSSSDGLSDSSFSLSSSSGRSPQRSRFSPAETNRGCQQLLKCIKGNCTCILAAPLFRGLMLTCCIKSVESRHSITVEHPEMTVVAGKQAGFTGGHNMIADNITTGRGRVRERIKKRGLSALYWRLLWKVLTPLVSVYYLRDVCFCPVYNNKGWGIQKPLHKAKL